VDLCYTVSQSIAEVFQAEYKIPVATIRNVPFERQLSDEVKVEKKLVYQGALNAGRGLEQLLEACSETDWKLDIFGDGDIATKLRALVVQLKLEDQVVFRGKMAPVDLWRETQKAYIGINLAEDKSLSYRYSLSNKLFDYIQAGIPQVAIDFPEFRRIFEQKPYGILIPSLEKDEIRAAINELLNNENHYKQLSDNCIALRTELCWEKESKILVKLYHELLR
jgi:glycosyltransferase involved in cell wall biosynthesis